MSGALALPWAELLAGRWTANWTDRPCSSAILIAGRVWPRWSKGEPPTWADVLACTDLSFSDRRWIVARYLARDRKLLVAWATDCAEVSAPRAGKWWADVRGTIADLRRWCSGEAVDIKAVRGRAWATRRAAAYAADAAAAYAADADAAYAAYAAAAYAADAALKLSLPYLERARLVEVTW